MATTPRPKSDVSRRALVRTAGWSLPVVALAAAAPAYAVSPTAWTITSDSWEGTAGGIRNDDSTLRMRFTIVVPAGTTIQSPTATLQFGTYFGFFQIRAGGGTAANGWTTTKQQPGGGEWARFIYTRPDITGPATIDLDFDLTAVNTSGSNTTIATMNFTSATPGFGATTTFTVLASNRNNYVTSPPG